MKKISILVFIFCFSSLFSWEKFYSVEAECEISFPVKPHHIKQIIAMKEEKTNNESTIIFSSPNMMCVRSLIYN